MSQTWGYGPGAQPPPARRRHDGRDEQSGRGDRWPDQPPRQRRRAAQQSKRLGSRAGRFGVLMVIGSSALGALATVLAGREPGTLLGVFLVVGTVVGTLVVRPRASHLIIPAPAPAYLAAALAAGMLRGGTPTMSRTNLAVNALQWTAGGFLPMVVATVLSAAIAAARWRLAARPRSAP